MRFCDRHLRIRSAPLAILVRDGVSEPLFDRDRYIFVNRAGMGLLFLNAQLGQHLEDDVRLDLKLPGQLVNPDLQLHR